MTVQHSCSSPLTKASDSPKKLSAEHRQSSREATEGRTLPAIRKMPLTSLGIPWLWGADVERAWRFMRYNVVPFTRHIMVPGSHVYGISRLPQTGGAVLAVNHLSAIDGPLVGAFSTRAIWYMMKAELAEIPVIGEILMWAGGFPIQRSCLDRKSLRHARELLRSGHIVGICVEGTRQRRGYPADRIHAGAIALATKAKVPVIPCAVESFQWSLRNRRACCVVYGHPLSIDTARTGSKSYKETAELLRLEIIRLWRQAGEAVAAGFPLELSDGTRRERQPRPKEFKSVKGRRRVSGISGA